MTITYRRGNDLNLDAVIRLYERSTLGKRRPMDDRKRMASMIEHANLVFTAWEGDKLVGIARSLTDFTYCTYVSDVAVDEAYQRKGIGKELLRLTREAAPQASIILLAAPAAMDYYPKLGYTKHPSAWTLRGDEPNRG